MYFNGTKCTSLLFCCLVSLSLMAKDVKSVSGMQGLKKPLSFVENKGQVTDQDNNPRNDVQYKLSTPGMSLFIGNGQLHYQFKKIEGTDVNTAHATTYRMDVSLVGANTQAKVIASDMQSYTEHYFFPQFGDEGLHVNSYNKIIYKDVYPNIDWVLYVKNNKVEYDFVVHEGGNVNDIKLQYAGATELHTTKKGGIYAETPMGAVQEKAPYAYESNTGKNVTAKFKLHNNIITFETGNYKGALTIDPYLQWSTYFGGTGEDVATGVKQTAAGEVYVCGYTASTGLATGVPAPFQSANAGVTYDAFLARYTAAGALRSATYFGGAGTNTQATGVTVDNAATLGVYITGYTTSAGLATAGPGIHQNANAGLNDAFVAKFDAALNTRSWCSYFGGTNNDYAYSITLDGSNNIYIAGQTASTSGIATAGTNQTVLSGVNDAFIAKFNSSLGFVYWSTYYGGTAQDEAFGIACDPSNNPTITGQTNSIVNIASGTAFQSTLNGTNDAFVAQFDGNVGTLNWGTYFGGSGTEQGNGIVCDPVTGSYAIVGNTTSPTDTFIASTYAAQSAYAGGPQDAFVAYFTNTGTRLWSTYYGGPGVEYGQGICLDSFSNIVIAGATFSSTGIASQSDYQPAIGGDYDAFVTKFTPYGQLLWGTYFGGALYDYANSVSCAFNDQIIIAGYTTSTSGIATAGAAQTTNGGGTYDAFVSEFKNDTLVVINQPFTDTLICAGGTLNVNYTTYYNFQADNTFTVELSDITGSFASPTIIGSVSSNTSGTIVCSIPSVIVLGSGYRIQIVASDPAFTSPDDLYNIDIVTTLPPTSTSANTPVCSGYTLNLYDTANYIVSAYNWAFPNGLNSTLQDPVIDPVDPTYAGTYTVTTSHNGCPDNTDTISVIVNTFVPPTPSDSASTGCVGATIYLFANPDTAISGITYNWIGPAGFTSTLQNPTIDTANPANAGYYFVSDTVAGCPSATSSVYVAVNNVTPASISITATPGDTICNGSEITFTATSENGGLDPGYQWMTGTSTPIVGAISSTFSSLDLTNGATISCILTSNVDCPSAIYYSSNVITVTVIDNTPLSHITANPGTTVAIGQTVRFSSTVFNPGTLPVYEWVVNGVPVAGATADTFTIHNVTMSDTVKMILYTTNTCAAPDSAISNTLIIKTTTGIPLISALDNISLFPNPNTGSFSVKGDLSGLSNNNITLEISNPLGQTVYKENAIVPNGELDKNLDVSNVPDGIYLLNITGDGQSKVIRFSITH